MKHKQLPSKTCIVCGRDFTWRKKWEKNWEQVRYCSDQCRKIKRAELNQAIEQVIMDLIAIENNISPTDAARKLEPNDWQKRLPSIQMAARRLAHKGQIAITQNGKKIHPSKARGEIRLNRI